MFLCPLSTKILELFSLILTFPQPWKLNTAGLWRRLGLGFHSRALHNTELSLNHPALSMKMNQHPCHLYELMSQFHPLLFLPTVIYISVSLAYFFEKIHNLLIPNNLSYSFFPFPCRTGKELFAISLGRVWPCIAEVHV